MSDLRICMEKLRRHSSETVNLPHLFLRALQEPGIGAFRVLEGQGHDDVGEDIVGSGLISVG
jgi:hypothetical protein